MSILDLDDHSTWKDLYTAFLQQDVYWNEINHIIKSKEKEAYNNLSCQLRYDEKHVDQEDIRKLRRRFTEFFEKTFTHVVAYHGCRPVDIEPYKTKGIIPCDIDERIKIARELFEELDDFNGTDFNNAITDIGKGIYFEYSGDKVGFFVSRQGLMESNHYLQSGSEVLQAIASKLGKNASDLLESRGTPTIIKCDLPIEWLDVETKDPIKYAYAVNPFADIISEIFEPSDNDCFFEDAFMLKRHVPPDLIMDFIEVNLQDSNRL